MNQQLEPTTTAPQSAVQSAVQIDVLRVAQDARGFVFEPLAVAELLGLNGQAWANVHVVLSVPGVVRGNHYHHRGTEVCAVSGPTTVRYRVQGVVQECVVPAGQVWRFRFPPGVSHAFRSESEPTVLAAFNTEVHDPANPDASRDPLFE